MGLRPKTKQGWAYGLTQSKGRPKAQTKYEMGLWPRWNKDINKQTNTWEIKHANKHTRYQIHGQTRQLLKKQQIDKKNTEIEGEQG